MKKNLYLALSFIAPFAILLAAIFVSNAVIHSGQQRLVDYRYALACFAVVTVCIETRVRMGYKLVRTTLFWIHLSCAVPFFLILLALSLVEFPSWVSALETLLFLVVLPTGVVLYTRGIRKEVFGKNSAKV